MASKEQSAEDILAELHGNDDSSNSDEELDLGIENLKRKSLSIENEESPTKPEPQLSPLNEEKERHKQNLMQDLYDQISDDDEEDDTNGSQNDNPFQQQIKKEAVQLKEKHELDQRKAQGLKNFENVKDVGKKAASVLSTGVFSIFGKAKQAKEKIITDGVKAKVAVGIEKVGNSQIYQKGIDSQIVQKVKGGVQIVGNKVINEANEAGEKVFNSAINPFNPNAGEFERKNLDEYLKQEQENRVEENKQNTPIKDTENTFVINDEDEEIDVAQRAQEQKEQEQLIEKDEIEVPDHVHLKKLIQKGERIELDQMDQMELQIVLTRKEVKNVRSIRNLVSSYEDRYLLIVRINKISYLVVLKKYLALASETKKALNNLYQQTKQTINQQLSDTNPTNQDPTENPYVNENPYDQPEPLPEINAPQTLEELRVSNPELVDDIMLRPHWVVKSFIQLHRIFMIDITQKGIFKTQISLAMHFVNQTRNPGSAPKIKSYLLPNDMINHRYQQEFLLNLEKEAVKKSQYYRRLKEMK